MQTVLQTGHEVDASPTAGDEEVPRMTPLRIALMVWQCHLPTPLRRSMVESFHNLSGRTIIFGTMYSGTDIVAKAMHALSAHLAAEHKVQVNFESAFMCEQDPKKRAFLAQQFPDRGMLFEDAANLAKAARVKDVITGKWCNVPSTSWLIGGFSCVSKTPCNNSRAKHRNCIADSSTAETAVTWQHISDYVDRVSPPVVLMENVVQLAGQGEANSDLNEIMKSLTSRSYAVREFYIEAKDYGSIVSRNRLFIVAIKAAGPEVLNRIKLFLDNMKASWETCREVLPLSAFLVKDYHLYFKESEPDLKKAKPDPKSMDELQEAYSAMGCQWPPAEELHPEFFSVQIQTFFMK